MSRVFTCPDCHQRFRVDDPSQTRRCRDCGSVLEAVYDESSLEVASQRGSASGKSGRKKKARKRSGSKVPWIIGGVGVAGLVVGVVAWLFTGGQPAAPIPENGASTSTPASGSSPAGIAPTLSSKFEHAVGGFSCDLPGPPHRRPDMEEPGMEAYTWVTDNEELGYLVEYITLPERATKGKSERQILAFVPTSVASDGTFTDQVISTDQGHEALTFKAVMPNGAMRHVRAYYHRNAVLVFEIAFFKGTESLPDVERFFQSIKLTP